MAFPPDGKKDKGAAAPEAKACANCLAPDSENGVALKACTRCKLTHYCGRACHELRTEHRAWGENIDRVSCVLFCGERLALLPPGHTDVRGENIDRISCGERLAFFPPGDINMRGECQR